MLVTGATGSFGKAFVRAMLDADISERICVYSRDEFKQHQMAEEFDDPRLRFFIGDVRDQQRLRRAMEGVSVVVHAAALKRIEVGVYNPGEMVKTNVLGTMNVIGAAQDAKVERVVYLSTDKAYQPISPYGQSKAIGESLILAANHNSGELGPKFAVTRYGNIANSTGSVIPHWRQQIKEGKPITVTDYECTRFFMELEEAIDLVFGAVVTDKELHIPTLPAYRLGDLAEAMMKVYSTTLDPDINVVGLPPHEKKHESMSDEQCSETARRMTVTELREWLTRTK